MRAHDAHGRLDAPRPRRSARGALAAPSPFAAGLALAAAAAVLGTAGPPASAARHRVADARCAAADPVLATTLFARGGRTAAPAVVSFQRAATTAVGTLADQGAVGASYGLAYDRPRHLLYAAAYHKRGAPLGPGGPGAVYRIDVKSGGAALWATVPNAGPDAHDAAGDHFPDAAARAHVGKTGLGDIDLSIDGDMLFVMNLADRRIYRYRTADAMLLDALSTGGAAEPWAADARPFALAVGADTLFHGVVDSAERSQAPADLAAMVYASDLDGAGMRQVARVDLDFDRGLVDRPAGIPARWGPWNDRFVFKPGPAAGTGWNIQPQPLLSDIVFSAAGDMVLGFRDRYGDMGFYDPSGRNPNGEGTTIPAGDVVLARRSGDTWRAQTSPEFFAGDAGPGSGGSPAHDETGFGGLAWLDASDEVVTSATTPLAAITGGALWFDAAGGANTARRELYRWAGGLHFAKANGLGDVEQLCELPPPDAPTATVPPPTATVAPPTTTPTSPPSPTHTPAPTPTASPTPAATAPATRIYLPIAVRTHCDAMPADVALVIDLSTSMNRPGADGGRKLTAVLSAAATFVRLLQMTPSAVATSDRVAVVGFNDVAWVEVPLTADPAAAEAALGRLERRQREGTRLDLAFSRGAEALRDAPRSAGRSPVLVLLTDGLPNRVPLHPVAGNQEGTVLDAAQAAKSAGITVFTIGFGRADAPDIADRVLPWLLEACASGAGRSFIEPRGDRIVAIYATIAAAVACRGGADGRPPWPLAPPLAPAR